ncbi:MAG: hypothetical protein O3C27_17085 [Actinomycetota bacterium]|nr:hypothetical protein [Actinomycetota bacterium]
MKAPGTAVAVQSSETVWKSTNGGGSWTKVWNKEVGPNLTPIGYFDGALYAPAGQELWLSRDNGNSWQKGADGLPGSLHILQTGSGRLVSPAGAKVAVSDDGGATWETRRSCRRMAGSSSSALARDASSCP